MATISEPRTSNDLMMLLSQAGHALACELTAALEEVGISPRANCVLTTALTGDLTQGRLAELCQLDKTTMVVTIDELERAGLAERTPVEHRPPRADHRRHAEGRADRRDGQADRRRASTRTCSARCPRASATALLDGLAALVGDGGRLAQPAQCERAVRRPRAAAAAAPQ